MEHTRTNDKKIALSTKFLEQNLERPILWKTEKLKNMRNTAKTTSGVLKNQPKNCKNSSSTQKMFYGVSCHTYSSIVNFDSRQLN